MLFFSWREIARCFWATGVSILLAGNRMTIVAFEIEVSEVLNLRKTCYICKWKEKVQKNTGGRRKFKLRKLLSKDFIF